MSSAGYPTRINVIFCDDVRREVGNKISVMGVYTGLLGIAASPATMAKLVALIVIDAPTQEVVGATVAVKVFDHDKELLAAEAAWPPVPRTSADPRVNARTHLTMPVELVGFVATDGMELRLDVVCGNSSFTSDPLRIVNISENGRDALASQTAPSSMG